MKIHQGLLIDALQKPSPHHNARPVGVAIDTIIVHGISLPPGEFGGTFIHDLFLGTLDHSHHPYFQTLQGIKVSSHLLIDRQGVITQFVPFDRRAWHAGDSFFHGRMACNDFSIGIELEGTDDAPYEEQQYQSLAAAVRALMGVYPAITLDRVVGHSDVAPGRKTDPGPSFDWLYFRKWLGAI